MSQPRIFISYSRKDRDITQRLVSDLHKAGAEVWVDVDGIQSGNFMQAIDKALAHCDWMVLVLSPSAIASEYVPEETYTALHRVKQGYMKGVIPVLVTVCQPGSIPPQWDVLQRYDAIQEYASALDGVLRAIGLPSPEPSFGPSISLLNPAPSPLLAHSSGPAIPPEQFPASLAKLGYEGRVINGVDVIVPPVCEVPAGEFLMGSDSIQDQDAVANEMPQHWVTLSTFHIAQYPVTVAEFACFVRAGQPTLTRAWFGPNWQTQLQRLDHPVMCMSWHNARSYTNWLSHVTGQSWRLPTEAEWEKAARGTDRRLYPWGNEFEQWRCNTRGSGKKTTTPVGLYTGGASPYGVQDMVGNVWEWTSSRLLSYPYSVSDGDSDSDSTGRRVLRGACWFDYASNARAAIRNFYIPDGFDERAGLRLVRATPSS